MYENVFIISHRRSGTHFTIDLIRNNFRKYYSNYVNIDRLNSRHKKTIGLESFKKQFNESNKIIKSHMHSDMESFFEGRKCVVDFVQDLMRKSKVIYVYRDGRDVLVSLYNYVQSFSISARETKFADFIRLKSNYENELRGTRRDRVEYWRYHVEGWLGQYNIQFISFENLLNDYIKTVKKIADFLDMDIPDKIKNVTRKEEKDIYLLYLEKLLNKITQKYTSVSFDLTTPRL